MRVLVCGASGYIGTHLVPRLLAAGHAVRASSRNADVLHARAWPGVEVVAADAQAEASLDAALRNVEVAYYLVHSMASGNDFARLDREAARNFRRAAERAGVGRIIYLGGLQPGGEQSAHLASRAETGDVLRDGSVPVTEIRAGIIVGAGSAAFEVIRDLALHLRVMTTPRWVRSRTQPIALDDLLTYLERLLDTPETAGRTFEVGGPEVLSYETMMRQFAEVNGRKVTIIPLPILSPRISSYWLDLVTAVPRNVAKPLIDGLKHDLLANDAPIRTLIPVRLHTYREAILAALAMERAQAVPARWTEGALRYRAGRPEVSFYSKRATATRDSSAPVEALWDVVASVGGKNGWYAYNGLWRLRGLLDRALGGTGMRRGRRHPSEVRVGDAIDWWRVASVEPGQRLTLLAEMKLPGSAVLEFEVAARPDGGSRLTTTARFHPAGVFGLLYWIPLIPVHGAIFDRMTEAMARQAEEAAATR
ncbi:MAG: SDR family oxidoreductase [Chloroflexi bacterium]|nr:SDR family oxidoreductase [Chloroflexota bacterium]MDA1240951.1 SDR family oxidoreductase [Chloroflexota bacterium]